MRFQALVFVAAFCLATSGCATKCTFASECDGNTLKTCGPVNVPFPVGEQDQEQSTDCVSLGGRCVQTGPNQASCQAESCDASFTPACESATIAIYCNNGQVATADCSTELSPTTGEPEQCVDLGGGQVGCE